MASCGLITLVLVALLAHRATAAYWRTQFQQWYPEYRVTFQTIRLQNCSSEFQLYLHGNGSASFDVMTGNSPTSRLAQPLVNCLLSHASEFVKSNMASAQVLLGLTPAILSLIGPSVNETGVLCVIGRRPLLCLLIVAGAPSVYSDRAFEHQYPTRILKNWKGRKYHPELKIVGKTAVTLLEYVVACLSIANLAQTCYMIGVRSAPNFAPHIPYGTMLWTWIGIIIHLIGCWALHLRIQPKPEHSSISSWRKFIRAQVEPVAVQRPMGYHEKNESYLSIFLSWVASIMIICHIIFGTLIWSSLLFISVRDSLMIIARFISSAMASRAVLMYELAALRDIHVKDDHERRDSQGSLLKRTDSGSLEAS